jgi:hypothetical protein
VWCGVVLTNPSSHRSVRGELLISWFSLDFSAVFVYKTHLLTSAGGRWRAQRVRGPCGRGSRRRTHKWRVFTGFSAVFVYKTHLLTSAGGRWRAQRVRGPCGRGSRRRRTHKWRFSLDFRLFSSIKPIFSPPQVGGGGRRECGAPAAAAADGGGLTNGGFSLDFRLFSSIKPIFSSHRWAVAGAESAGPLRPRQPTEEDSQVAAVEVQRLLMCGKRDEYVENFSPRVLSKTPGKI